MASYRLSRLAAEDLLEIATYGLERFGLEQSLKYRDSYRGFQADSFAINLSAIITNWVI